MRLRVVLALLTTRILALPITASAQEATFTGQVTDTTGAVLPGVVVRAIHEATGTTTEVVTDGRRGFRIPTRIGRGSRSSSICRPIIPILASARFFTSG